MIKELLLITSIMCTGASAMQPSGSGEEPDIKRAKNDEETAGPLLSSEEIHARNSAFLRNFIKAVRAGDINLCTALIERCEDVNLSDSKGITPLLVVTGRGLSGLSIALIEKGADVNAVAPGGDTPLHRAAFQGLSDVCLALIEKSANVNAVNFHRHTPLYLAAAKGLSIVCFALIEKGADVNAVGGQGYTPLYCAAARRLPAVCLALIEKGAQVVTTDTQGLLMWAYTRNHKSLCLALIKGGSPEIFLVNSEGETLLHLAAKKGDNEIFNALIEAGANVNTADNDGWRPLHWAADSGFISECLQLLKAGSDVNARDNEQSAPLHWAAANGHADLCRVLIQAGAHIEALDKDGHTPFRRAAKKGRIDACAILFKMGARVDNLKILPSIMQVLAMHNRSLKFVPKEIGRFKALRELLLHNNDLQEIPACIGELSKLEVLTVNNCKLKTLPSELSKLAKLKVFNAMNNTFGERIPKSKRSKVAASSPFIPYFLSGKNILVCMKELLGRKDLPTLCCNGSEVTLDYVKGLFKGAQSTKEFNIRVNALISIVTHQRNFTIIEDCCKNSDLSPTTQAIFQRLRDSVRFYNWLVALQDEKKLFIGNTMDTRVWHTGPGLGANIEYDLRKHIHVLMDTNILKDKSELILVKA